MQIKHFDTLPEDAVFIRKEVFVKEQGFKNEFDEKDNEAHFFVGYENMKGNIHVQKDVVKRHQMSLNVICNRELQSLTSEKCSEINIIVFIC